MKEPDLSDGTEADLRAATTPEQLHLASFALLLQSLRARLEAYPNLGSGALLCLAPTEALARALRAKRPRFCTITENFRSGPGHGTPGLLQAFAPLPRELLADLPFLPGSHAWLDLDQATTEEAHRVALELGGIIERRLHYPLSQGGQAASIMAAGKGQAAIPGIREARGPHTLLKPFRQQPPR